MKIPGRGRKSGVLSLIPLEKGKLCIKGIVVEVNGSKNEIFVDDKGFPVNVIGDVNLYKFEKLGVHFRRIIIRERFP